MMSPIRTERDAKEFLAAQIVAEAERSGVPLSEVERKTLYFSETGWNLPDRDEVNAEFERDYDQDAYEEKISGLVRSIYARDDRTDREIEAWSQSFERLGDEDHYVLVLISGADSLRTGPRSPVSRWLPKRDGSGKREPGDLKRLIILGLGFGAVLLIAMIVASIFR